VVVLLETGVVKRRALWDAPCDGLDTSLITPVAFGGANCLLGPFEVLGAVALDWNVKPVVPVVVACGAEEAGMARTLPVLLEAKAGVARTGETRCTTGA
jgi:hypothetical protein